MALGKYFKRHEATPAPVTEPAPTASGLGDIEKASPPSYGEGEHTTEPYHIDPAIEKRVVRKFDRNIVPLVMALCMASLNSPDLD
jgi:hypothetical protein